MPPIGPHAAVDLALPDSIDTSIVLNFQMQEGLVPDQVIAEAAVAIGSANEELMNRFGNVTYLTTAPMAYYSQGTGDRSMTPKKVEYKQADGVRAAQGGHMLPIDDYEDAVAWTPRYLRRAFPAQLTNDIELIVERWKTRFLHDFYARVLTDTAIPMGSGVDAPWAIGTGAASWVPPQYGSYPAFTSSHTHFIAITGSVTAANAKLLLEAFATDLMHHGHTGRINVQVSLSDVAAYAAITKNFVKYVPSNIQVIGGNTNSPVYVTQGELEGTPGEIFGLYLSDVGPVMILSSEATIPSGYAWATKSYGKNSSKNGVAVREYPAPYGFGLFPDPQLTASMNPELDKILFKGSIGIGTNSRSNGVAGFIGDSTWANPTFDTISDEG